MPDFKLIKNGYVDASLTDQEITNLFANLKLLRRDSYNDFDLVMKGYVAVETLQVVKKLTGNDFPAFLSVNFRGGSGPVAHVIRDIIGMLNGRQGHQGVLSAIRMEEHALEAQARSRAASYQSSTRPSGQELLLKDGYQITDYDLYRLCSGIGVAALGRFFLLLGGDSSYA